MLRSLSQNGESFMLPKERTLFAPNIRRRNCQWMRHVVAPCVNNFRRPQAPDKQRRGRSQASSQSQWRGLSSETKCNTPRRFDIGKVVQDLKECCHAILSASVGGRKRPDRYLARRWAVGGRHRPGARSGESHHLQGAAAERTPLGWVFAASRRRSLSTAQAA